MVDVCGNVGRGLVALGVMVISTTALADTQTADRRELDAIVVTAQAPTDGVAWETDPKLPRQPVPASDGADYLKTIPGFTAIRNGGSNGDPVLRGMFGSRLNVLSNGGNMPGACPARMDNPLSYVAPETFDRLIVVKGPQTVLWGPGASAGTVRFERNIPRFAAPSAQATASTLVGSNGRQDAVIDASAGASQGYVRLSGNTSEADDYQAGDGSRVPSAWDKWNADLALGWTPDANTVLELGIGRGDGEARYAGRSMDGAQFDRHSTTLRYEKTAMGGLLDRIEISAYRNDVDHVMDNYSLRDPNPHSAMPMPMASNVARLTKGGRLALDLDFSRWRATLGMDAQNSLHKKRMGMGRDTYAMQAWNEDARLSNRGVFAEAYWGAGPQTRWVAGARVDRADADDRRVAMPGPMQVPSESPQQGAERSRKETLGSGFLRYEWQAVNGISGFAGLGHARRMPDYWELFSPKLGPRGAPDAFAGIAPERTTQLDLGVKYRSLRWDAWANAYLGRIDDYILFFYGTGVMNPSPMQMGEAASGHDTGAMAAMSRADNIRASVHGGEAGVEYRPREPLKLGVTLASAWGENRDAGGALPQMPPLEMRMSAVWEAERWSAGVLWRLVDAQDRVAVGQGNVVGQDLSESKGFGTLALNTSVRVGSNWRVSAGVDNVFDRAFSEHLNLAGSADFGYPADPVRILEPGRTAWLKLDFSY